MNFFNSSQEEEEQPHHLQWWGFDFASQDPTFFLVDRLINKQASVPERARHVYLCLQGLDHEKGIPIPSFHPDTWEEACPALQYLRGAYFFGHHEILHQWSIWGLPQVPSLQDRVELLAAGGQDELLATLITDDCEDQKARICSTI